MRRAAGDASTEPQNQSCGDCRACCRELIIDHPVLRKHAGVMCSNCSAEKGCTTYQTRPQVCRDFMCGWRNLPLPEEWRPDRCQILITHETENPAKGVVDGVKFFFFGRLDRIFWRPFILFASELIAEDKVVYISVPGPSGYCSQMVAINPLPELKHAIATWNYAAVVGIVAGIIQTCIDTPPDPVVFKSLPIQ
jgi:hypothetical protein